MPLEPAASGSNEEAPTRRTPVLGYQSLADPVPAEPLRLRWLVVLAVLMYGTSFFLPTVRIFLDDHSEPGWWATRMAFWSVILGASSFLPDVWQVLLDFDIWLHLIGLSVNLTFMMGLIMWLRAASRRGRLLGRTTRGALCWSAVSFFSAVAFLSGFYLRYELVQAGTPVTGRLYDVGAYAWAVGPGLLMIAALRNRVQK